MFGVNLVDEKMYTSFIGYFCLKICLYLFLFKSNNFTCIFTLIQKLVCIQRSPSTVYVTKGVVRTKQYSGSPIKS